MFTKSSTWATFTGKSHNLESVMPYSRLLKLLRGMDIYAAAVGLLRISTLQRPSTDHWPVDLIFLSLASQLLDDSK